MHHVVAIRRSVRNFHTNPDAAITVHVEFSFTQTAGQIFKFDSTMLCELLIAS